MTGGLAKVLAGIGLAACLAASALAAEPVAPREPLAAPEPSSEGDFPSRTAVAIPHEPGAWRTRSQTLYDPRGQETLRKAYTVWDIQPSQGLDFVWLPDDGGLGGPGRPNGAGRLVWRRADKPSYDPEAFVAEYRGTLRGGRAEGEGSYRDRAGLAYEGRWAAGLPEGAGRLTLGSGAEYTGRFRGGAAEGAGRFYDVDGEVFEGGFRGGLREGVGVTRLPNGGSYRSEWAGGEELPNSRTVRLAQLGPGQTAQDDVRLGVSVDRVESKSTLQYATANTDAGLVIQPGGRRLMGLWKGNDDLQLTEPEEQSSDQGSYGVFAYAGQDLAPLTLVFEVQNRASAPVRITGAYLDVDASVTDLQPAIQLTGGSSGECSSRPRSSYDPRFELENWGWGPAERARLRFAFAPARANPPSASFTTGKDVGSIVASARVNFEPELRAAGVRVDLLRQREQTGGLTCRSKGNASACLAEIVATGVFGTLGRNVSLSGRDVGISVAGLLDYVWADGKGVETSRSSPFNARLLLGRTPVEAECGEGAEREKIAKRVLDFRLDQSRYRIPVAFERSIPAGRSARYTVDLKAAKSSEHDFRVVLQLSDGRRVTSRPIRLTYFTPNAAGRLVR